LYFSKLIKYTLDVEMPKKGIVDVKAERIDDSAY
jgi:hypothetical protein